MIRRTLLITAAVLAALPGAAHASATQESMFQDDNMLEFAPPAKVAKTLDRLKSLGVDRLRVTVFWVAVAPDPTSDAKPKGLTAPTPTPTRRPSGSATTRSPSSPPSAASA